jgi:hypothetical protein
MDFKNIFLMCENKEAGDMLAGRGKTILLV